MYIHLHIKCQLFWSRVNEITIFSADFRKIPKTKLHKNPSNGSRVVPYGRTHGHAHTAKLIVAFHSFAKEPKNDSLRIFPPTSGTNILKISWGSKVATAGVGGHAQHEQQVTLMSDDVKLTFRPPLVLTFKNSIFCLQNCHLYFYDYHGSHNKQRLFPYSPLIHWLFS